MNNSFAAQHPELIYEWSEKNLPLTPDRVSYGSNKRVWWRAACGHEWQTSVKSRSAGEKCPICSGARAVEGINDLATLKPELACEWAKKNELKPTQVSLGSRKKVSWRCKQGHEWEATIKSRTTNGTGCPYCSHNKVLAGFNDLASQYPEVAAEWSERNYPLKPTMVTAFANRKVWWRCGKGHEWNTLISTRSGGSQCPFCSGLVLLKGFNDFSTMNPALAEEWSERNLPLMPDMVNEKSRKNVWWKCKHCGYEWKSLVKSRVKGAACPVCADRVVLAGHNDLATTDAELLQEWDYEKNAEDDPTKLSRSSMRSVWWKCSIGHSWKAKINERTMEGRECRVCEKEYLSGMRSKRHGLRKVPERKRRLPPFPKRDSPKRTMRTSCWTRCRVRPQGRRSMHQETPLRRGRKNPLRPRLPQSSPAKPSRVLLKAQSSVLPSARS